MKQSFYGKLRAQGYDIGTDQTEIVQFYLGQWERLGKPEPILEPMCGTGLNLIPFLQVGAVCDGLDSSPHMLTICQSKLDVLNLTCNLFQQNLETMELPKQYGLIIIPGGSFGHIYDKTIATQCLKRLQGHLIPGGWLVFDVRPPAYISVFGQDGLVDYDLTEYPDGSTDFTTGYWQHLDEGKVIQKWNKIERFVNNQLVETEIFDYRERLYDVIELKAQLTDVGFNEIQVMKAYEPNTQPVDKDGIVFSCRKG
jgi:ubiquinone/menaquinone biosynthesis C-methylase UbiE